MLKPDSRRGGKPVPLPAATEPGEIVLERPRLEQLTAAQEAEAVDLLAALFAAAARHRFGHARAGRRQASNRAHIAELARSGAPTRRSSRAAA